MEGHDMDRVDCPTCEQATLRGLVAAYGHCSDCMRKAWLERKAGE